MHNLPDKNIAFSGGNCNFNFGNDLKKEQQLFIIL